MTINLEILIDSKIPSSLLEGLDLSLSDVFQFTNITINRFTSLPSDCWDKFRSQYDADCLLNSVLKSDKSSIILLLVSYDIYIKGLNFVFGVAEKDLGAIVSTSRLENNPDFLLKEVTHELGHVFGLRHCRSLCVMTFSNSILEAKNKNSFFCKKCKTYLRKRLKDKSSNKEKTLVV